LRLNYVLIDFENVRPESVASLIPEHFRVIIFVGESQTKLPFDFAAALQRLGERVEYVKISGNGKNALDFHIAFYIGQLAAQDSPPYFHIISRDTGFDPLIEHLKTRKISAARSPTIDAIPLLKLTSKKSPLERAEMYREKFNKPKVAKAAKSKTLSRSIATFFGNQLSETEILEVVESLKSLGWLSIANGKVSYESNGSAAV
jgi:hypothetical protein